MSRMRARDPFALVVASLAVSSVAQAAEGGGWATVAYHAINFAILAAAVVYFAKRPIARALEARADGIAKDIDEASRLHAEARQMLDEYEAKIGKLEAEKAELLETYRREGEAEKARMVEEAKAEAERIRREARRSAENELSRARERLEAEVIDLAIASAEKAIAEKMTPADHRRLTADYLSRLEETSPGT
jgi:F-type H+-transporting ATPase subunit b